VGLNFNAIFEKEMQVIRRNEDGEKELYLLLEKG
jgi:hypothetical protein